MTKLEAIEYIKQHKLKYYVYVISSGKAPVYVGKGVRYRFKEHFHRLKEIKVNNKRWYNFLVNTNSTELNYKILFCKDEAHAFYKERKLIKALGRKGIDLNGVLLNIAEGGLGGCTNRIDKRKSLFLKKVTKDGYTLVSEFVNSYTPVTLVCKLHGNFTITPKLYSKIHVKCPECSKAAKTTKKLTTEDFIKKAKAKHGDKYGYSNTVYTTSRANVIITCKVHGDFLQNPRRHYNRGDGCKKCTNESKIGKVVISATKVSKFSLDGTYIESYESIKDAAACNIGANSSNISSCCRNLRKSHKGFIWKYY